MADRPETIDVVFLDRATLPEEIRLRPLGFPHRLTTHEGTPAGDVAARIADAEVVITNKAPVRAEAIAAAPRLKLIAVAATGTDLVDLAACTARGITVCNIRDYAVHTVPEHAFALMLALRRNLLAYRDSVRNGRWQESGQFCFFDHPVHDLAGSTLGIIGAGVLGKAFGMHVLFAARKGRTDIGPTHTPFERVLAESDVITLHSPLTPATRNMIGAAEFAAMARRPLLINTARGGLVDETALRDALVGGQIAGAGFDVATAEPPPAGHVLMELLKLPNFILTPHVAWSSREAIQGLADQLVENIELFVRGTPRNVVNAPSPAAAATV